jgi:hypothetical protein
MSSTAPVKWVGFCASYRKRDVGGFHPGTSNSALGAASVLHVYDEWGVPVTDQYTGEGIDRIAKYSDGPSERCCAAGQPHGLQAQSWHIFLYGAQSLLVTLPFNHG